MRELKNCKKCGKLFSTSYGSDLCINCEAEDETFFKLLKEYLYYHPGTSAGQLSEIFKVDTYRIYKYVKDGRLEIVSTACSNS